MKNNNIRISYHLTSLLTKIYGRQHSYELSDNLVDYKKMMKKFIKSIELSIAENVDTDATHQKSLATLILKINESIKQSTDAEMVKDIVIDGLMRLILLILGEIPDRDFYNLPSEGIKNAQSEWNLKNYRSLNYSRDYKQQKNIILLSAKKGIKDFDLSSEQIKAKSRDLKNDKKFVLWFKRTYPKIFVDLF